MPDPLNLEPKNGDFVSYIEQLNAGSLKDLKALQVAEANKASELMQQQNLFNLSDENQSSTTERQKTRLLTTTAQHLSKKLVPLVFSIGFTCFFAGAALDLEPLIFFGFFIIFFGMIGSAFAGKR